VQPAAKFVALTATLTLLLCLGCTRVPNDDDALGSIAIIGDTQMMTEPAPAELAGKFQAETAWLSANAASLHLRFAIQVGDLTNGTFKARGGTHPKTNPLGLTEMAYAKQAMDKLWRPRNGPAIPWTVALGNHDVDEWCWGTLLSPSVVSADPRCTGGMIIGGGQTRSTANFDDVFPPRYFAAMPTWGGQLDARKVANNFHRLTIGRQEWLIVSLMWAPQQRDFDWANRVIDHEVAQHVGLRVIVVTHGFMHPSWRGDPSTLRSGLAFGNARELYDNVLTRHPQIRLVLSGHYPFPVPSAPGTQCRDLRESETFGPCAWFRKATVSVPADGSHPAFSFHTVLTDYSYNGDPKTKLFYVQPDGSAEGPAVINRSISDNAFFRLLTFDTIQNTIQVRTMTDPANVPVTSPPPPGCEPTSLAELGLEASLCVKSDSAYGSSQDDYTLGYE
jgi:hypothetical protein